ncbi:glycosyltransferase family 4 protein [Parafrigoribacterium soli]|uniref:glycosyltransferase family 4 protein n=1 Tax=Parafrigoribacterium soli TaxID=3144663 RepID=UPI0032EDBE97
MDGTARNDDLRVALSMLTLVPGGMGGSETYARALTRHLVGIPGFTATAFVPALAAGFSEGAAETVIESVQGGLSTRARLQAVAAAITHGPSIRAAMSSADVVHYPFTVEAPKAARNQAVVQSVHDVQHLDLPHLFSRAELLYRRYFYEAGARRADIVVTISEFAKQRIVELLGIPEEKVRVAYLGVDSASFIPQHGPRENFVLYPARGWAHKNHSRLIEAVRIARISNPELRLVLTGGGLDALGSVPEWVDRKGLVSTEELRALYRSAAALVFPSLYEGFGLPPLEAMASGCPVAVSNVGSIPEICGDAAVFFDPLDPESIVQGMTSAIARTEELSLAGVVHAAKFTWEACRDSHLSAYRDARDRKRN